MRVHEVREPADEVLFWYVPFRIYRGDRQWCPQFLEELRGLFSEGSSLLLRRGGRARRWVLLDGRGEPVGRIAAFINPRYIKANNLKVGGIGFFECVDDERTAAILFDTAMQWLADEGMEWADGPINTVERNRWWGLMVEGFERSPSYGVNYNPPYYKSLFEQRGFKALYEQYTYMREAREPFGEKLNRWAERILTDPSYTFLHYNGTNEPKFIRDFVKVYNRAWADRPDFEPISEEEVTGQWRELKPLADPLLLWFAYHEGEPVAFFLMLPDYTHYLRKLRGRLHLWNKLRLWWYLKTGSTTHIFGFSYGVVPEHQRTGVSVAIVRAAAEKVLPLRPYQTIEMHWIGSFQKVMKNLMESFGCRIKHVHVTYRIKL